MVHTIRRLHCQQYILNSLQRCMMMPHTSNSTISPSPSTLSSGLYSVLPCTASSLSSHTQQHPELETALSLSHPHRRLGPICHNCIQETSEPHLHQALITVQHYDEFHPMQDRLRADGFHSGLRGQIVIPPTCQGAALR